MDVGLAEVTFQKGLRLREIGSKAFFSCGDLKSFTVPVTVTTIGESCFESCGKLRGITFEQRPRLSVIREMPDERIQHSGIDRRNRRVGLRGVSADFPAGFDREPELQG
jgi:hypothetical protein